jgi:hypothetical protein
MMRRICFRRRLAGADDEGVGLIFVMMIATVLLVVLGAAGATLVSQIRPTGQSVDDGAALAAAEAGIEEFVAAVNANCSPADGLGCPWLQAGRSGGGFPDTVATDETYTWTVAATVPNSGWARVKSVGRVPFDSGFRTKTLVADIQATPSFNNFEYFTKFETFPSDFVNSFYGPRDIQINSGSTSGSSLTGPGTLHWNGTCPSTDPNDLSHCTMGGATNFSTNICDDLYFPSAAGPGRGTDDKWDNVNRRPSNAVQSAMGTDSTFAYYNEHGSYNGTPETHTDTCDSSFEPNMVMDGPIYSQDAYLVDRGDDTGNSKNSMPIFGGNAYSMWDGTINGIQQPVNPNTHGHDRTYPNTDGDITTSIDPQPVYTTRELELPATAAKSQALAQCTYTGPTRILIKQNIAYITSPGTPTGPGACYTSTGSFKAGASVTNAQVPIASTLVYIKNPTSGTPAVATRANPVFNLATNLQVPPNTSGNTLAGTWTDNATYSSSAPCPAPADVTKRRNFDCETSAVNPPANVFAAIKSAVNSVVGGSDTDAAVHDDLVSAVKAKLDKSNVLVSSQPSTLNKGDVRYQLTVGAMQSGTATTTKPAAQSDAFFQSTAGQGYTATPESWSIALTRYSCTQDGGCGSNKITATNMLTSASTATRTVYAANSPVNSTSTFPWFGAQTGANTYTDPNNDITQYYNGYGDAYVEGTLKGSMTIVAEHDIVATNDLTYNNTNLDTTTDGLALVANHNVRVYRPMTCTDDGTAGSTTAGYCPDDLTGVYTNTLQWPLPTNYPALKYTPDNAPAMTSTGQGLLYATVFALRGCFMADNFYRGAIGHGVNVYGGLYQYHRGPTSLPYQGRPYQGSGTKMPGVTLTYEYDDMRAGQTDNGGLRVPWIPNPQDRPTGSPRTWNVIAVSTGS